MPAFILSIVVGAIAGTFSRRRVTSAGKVPYGDSTCDADATVALGFLAPWVILG
ncbi:MAG: hypothetical protein EOR99_35285 [Mesorhizobium sp.]|nr:MAG: hypothetical protein EOR99_35285 [Mesorhizobium sp.]